MNRNKWIVAAVPLALLAACANSSSSHEEDVKQAGLTPGNVKMTVVKGKTTQKEIVETFGAPDLVTHKDNVEVWTYDKTSYDYQKNSGYLTVILAGTGLSAAQTSAQAAAVAAAQALGVRSREFRITVWLLRQPDPALPSRNAIALDSEAFR